jgi:hypothetical protein
MAVSKWLSNIPKGPKIYQHFAFKDPPKFTQIGIFGSKRNHLATLRETWRNDEDSAFALRRIPRECRLSVEHQEKTT